MWYGKKLYIILSAAVMILIIFSAYDDNTFIDIWKMHPVHFELDEAKNTTFEILPSCGEICTYTQSTSKEIFLVPISNASIPRLEKQMNCLNLMRRMAWKKHIIVNPPPKQPPDDLVQEFTQNGEFPVQHEWYFNSIPRKHDGHHGNTNVSRGIIDDLISKKQAGFNLNTYVDHYCMQNISDKYRGDYAGLSGLVVGTVSPWLEAILLANGAEHILTLEYNYIAYDHPQLSASTPYDFAEGNPNTRVETFDFAASFSSIEHSGLARYGDPLNPYGDLEAMAQMWCVLKPGGLFIVGVPGRTSHPGYLRWNAHRFYGPERLKHLATNWNILEVIDCPGDPHVVMVLRKPTK